ncbi:hypothetical protein chiPu_0013791 [Chiloscyllium punctatum]|uniref:Uncharacterized protein n=1 Tax=Chiloscyllium punctatum TaxID=137246 RepID=A0A401SY31_CHIPU|nr:hypothetical protein [Chiloscyllium punctatum]
MGLERSSERWSDETRLAGVGGWGVGEVGGRAAAERRLGRLVGRRWRGGQQREEVEEELERRSVSETAIKRPDESRGVAD